MTYADAEHHHGEHDDYGCNDRGDSHFYDFLEREVKTE